jgi:arabinogalactan oligomer/maltooligosaccharide transport system permease protein
MSRSSFSALRTHSSRPDIVSVATTVVGLAVSTTAAYAFSRFRFPGRDEGMKAFLVTQMFPGVVMAVPLYILLDELRLLNNIMGLALVYSTTSVPFSVWMLKGYFDTIPKELEEAALVVGASQWYIFWRIVLPLARPAIVVTALFSFMTAWNEFILAATFLSGERNMTLPVVLQSYVDDNSTAWGPFAAGALVVSLPVMALFFALQKHLVGGLTSGGVKG